MDWDAIHSPLELAKRLWSEDGQGLTPGDFLKQYRRVRSATDDIKALWQLGGAANDYLRRHPHAFAAPADLARRLLSARHVDARIIGLKLLTRCDVPDDELLWAIIRTLKKRSNHEVCGGLHELGVWIDRQLRLRSKFNEDVLRPLQVVLQAIVSPGSADYNVETATRQLGYVQELI